MRALADKNFSLIKEDSNHPSLRLKQVGKYWPARAGLSGCRRSGRWWYIVVLDRSA